MGYNNRKEGSRGNVNSINWRPRPNLTKGKPRSISRLTSKETRSLR